MSKSLSEAQVENLIKELTECYEERILDAGIKREKGFLESSSISYATAMGLGMAISKTYKALNSTATPPLTGHK